MDISDTGYRAIVSSDWHADAVTLGVDRYAEIEIAARTIMQKCIDVDQGEERTVFVFAGDLTDPDNPRCWRAIQLAASVAYGLSTHCIPSVWLTGNHDVLEDGTGAHTLLPIANSNSLITVVDSPNIIEPLPGLSLVCLPYCARSRNYNPVTEIQDIHHQYEVERRPEPFMVVSHLMIEGIGPGSETKDFARGRDVFLPIKEIRRHFPTTVMVNGHYHLGQVYRDVHMPGSLARLTLGEASNSPRFLEIVR